MDLETEYSRGESLSATTSSVLDLGPDGVTISFSVWPLDTSLGIVKTGLHYGQWN